MHGNRGKDCVKCVFYAEIFECLAYLVSNTRSSRDQDHLRGIWRLDQPPGYPSYHPQEEKSGK